MELTEKLNSFYTASIEAASKRSSDEIEEFQASMDQQLEEFKKRKQAEAELRCQVEEEKQRREINRRVSEALIRQKRNLSQVQQARKEVLFGRVREKLSAFRKTEGYDKYLRSKIRMAQDFAGEDELIIYLNPTDAAKKENLERECGCALTISHEDFGGGIRAVVHARNVLIDESFQTKLKKEWENYTI